MRIFTLLCEYPTHDDAKRRGGALSQRVPGTLVRAVEPSNIDCAWHGEPTECEAFTMTRVRNRALAHQHIRKTEPAHQPARDEDPLASMHFE